jgi:hypothetical protein
MGVACLNLADPNEGGELTTDADSALAPDRLAHNIAAFPADAPVCSVKRLETCYEVMLASPPSLLPST